MNELKEIVLNNQPVTQDARDKIVNLLCIVADEDKPVHDYLVRLLDDQSGKRLRVAIKAHRQLMKHMKEIKEFSKRTKVDTKELWIERLKLRDNEFVCGLCRRCKLCATPKSKDMIEAMTKFPEVIDKGIEFEMDGKHVRLTARGVYINNKKANSWDVCDKVGCTINFIKKHFKEFVHT